MKRIIIFSVFTVLLLSCEDVFDKKHLNSVDGDEVWGDPQLMNLFLNGIYNTALPGFSGTANTNLSDESQGSGTNNMMYGLLEKDNYGIYAGSEWTVIRQTNMLLTEMGDIPQEEKDILMRQACFLRAWSYWKLVK